MALGGTVALRSFRRAAVILVIALLPVATVAVPSVAVAAQASRPTVLFLGAHGVGEGGGSSTSPWTDQWGTTIQAVWYRLNLNGVGAVPKAVSYPKVPVPANLNGYAQLGQWVTTKLAPSSITGNTSLINDMTSTYSACPHTIFLLAGYSRHQCTGGRR